MHLARPKVFVSYSHEDSEELEQLRDFLRPLERDGIIDPWIDTRIEGGEKWNEEIDKALGSASAAVLLVSQPFLASDFICREEIPRVLARQVAGDLTLIPVFLSPSSVREIDFAFVDRRTGETRKERLSAFQGYGTPDKTLSELSWPDRERALERLATRLRSLTTGPAVAAEVSRAVISATGLAASATTLASSSPARSYELTVSLRRNGDLLEAHYHLPGTEPIAAATLPWSDISQSFDSTCQVFEIAGDRGLKQWLERGAAACGPALFQTLFGDEGRWGPVLRTLFGRSPAEPQPTPVYASVRLRVCTDDRLLSGLPWRLTSWNGRLLAQAGWTFETTETLDPVENYTTTAPCNVLVVAPEAGVDGAAPDPGHAQAVRDLLAKVWPTGRDPGYLRVVKTRGELERALRGMQPHILYFYACGEATADGPALLLDGPRGAERLPLAALPRLFEQAGHRPAVVCLNTALPGAGPDAPSPAVLLGPGLPLLVWRRLPEWTADSTYRALAWLGRWLGDGGDPVAALHAVTRDELKSSAEAATLAAATSYRSWKTDTFSATLRHRVPHLALDRDHQKALVRKHLDELVQSDTRRVLALLGYAAAGHQIERLGEQLQYYLESAAVAHEIRWIDLRFPTDRSPDRLRRNLEEELKLQLEADPNEPVPHLLRRHAPKAVRPERRRTLWLRWGTFGPRPDHQAPLIAAQLGDWLRFSSEFLGTHCPPDLRVVSFAALESAEENHPRLKETLQKLRREQPWCRSPAFRLTDLPPLGKVAEEDLLVFLEDPGNSSCDPGIQAEVAQRVVTQSGGDFEATVRLLEEAEQGSWYDLLNRLRREQGAGPAGTDEPF